MRIAVIALTEGGAETAARLRSLAGTCLGLARQGSAHQTEVLDVKILLPAKLHARLGFGQPYSGSTAELIKEVFATFQGIVCIMAAGIVVRSIAPLLQGKDQDPGVVVVDEAGQFAVSLLSGHLGRANDLAREVAKVLGGTPVITTATDVQGVLAVDVLARDLGVKLEPVARIVKVNSVLARGQSVVLLTENPLPLGEKHPLWDSSSGWEVIVCKRDIWQEAKDLQDQGKTVVLFTARTGDPDVLCLRPQSIVAGVGCRRGIPAGRILAEINAGLLAARRSPLSLKKICSITEKAQEQGILEAVESLGVISEFYPKELLQKFLDNYKGLTQSNFVNQQMGVGGVCEPASLAGCRQGTLILKKQAKNGVTVALAEEECM